MHKTGKDTNISKLTLLDLPFVYLTLTNVFPKRLLLTSCFAKPFSFHGFVIFIAKNWYRSILSNHFYIIKVNKRRAGFLSAYPFSTDGIFTHLLAIHPSFQGKGIGKILAQHFFERCAENGAVKIILDVDTQNYRSLHFWKRLGCKIMNQIHLVQIRSNDLIHFHRSKSKRLYTKIKLILATFLSRLLHCYSFTISDGKSRYDFTLVDGKFIRFDENIKSKRELESIIEILISFGLDLSLLISLTDLNVLTSLKFDVIRSYLKMIKELRV